MGYAKPDTHRKLLQGNAEIIYGAGKTPEQISGIIDVMKENGEGIVLITRLSAEAYQEVSRKHDIHYYEDARIGILGELPKPDGIGRVVVATGGTSDIPVAEEAAQTAEYFGARVERIYDVGVSGIHRVLSKKDLLVGADCVIAVAGMEGALASVVGGLVSNPVIAVPTSVGYGASFGGMSALLTMINSCANGITVVNIDNGYGAGYVATQIYRLANK